jgi:hypothetical protein
MFTRTRLALGGGLAGLVALAFSVGLVIAQDPSPSPTSQSGAPLTHEQMHQMMDMMHGPGTSERMHEAMGADAEALMDQCAAMMAMMPGMMQGRSGRPMQDMMDRMMGR